MRDVVSISKCHGSRIRNFRTETGKLIFVHMFCIEVVVGYLSAAYIGLYICALWMHHWELAQILGAWWQYLFSTLSHDSHPLVQSLLYLSTFLIWSLLLFDRFSFKSERHGCKCCVLNVSFCYRLIFLFLHVIRVMWNHFMLLYYCL